MIAFKQHLEESLNSAYPWKRTGVVDEDDGRRKYWYEFHDQHGNTHSLYFEKMLGKVEVGFKTNDTYRRATTIPNAIKIYATIAQITRAFILSNKSSIDHIFFTAWDARQDSLYAKFIHRMAKELNGTVSSASDGYFSIKF